jgi:hypothetical protein
MKLLMKWNTVMIPAILIHNLEICRLCAFGGGFTGIGRWCSQSKKPSSQHAHRLFIVNCFFQFKIIQNGPKGNILYI